MAASQTHTVRAGAPCRLSCSSTPTKLLLERRNRHHLRLKHEKKRNKNCDDDDDEEEEGGGFCPGYTTDNGANIQCGCVGLRQVAPPPTPPYAGDLVLLRLQQLSGRVPVFSGPGGPPPLRPRSAGGRRDTAGCVGTP